MDSTRHYTALYTNSPGEFAFTAGTTDELRQWKTEFRGRLRDITGLRAIEQDLAGHTPHAELLKSESLDGYTRESWQL